MKSPGVTKMVVFVETPLGYEFWEMSKNVEISFFFVPNSRNDADRKK